MKKINIYLFCSKEQIYDYLTYFTKQRRCNWELIVLAKDNPPPFCHLHYLKDKEYCLYFWETGVRLNTTTQNAKTVYFTNTGVAQADKKLYDHPTIKPLKIIKNLIEISSSGGGLILDPFAGSGTTAVAAKELGRKYLGFEINGRWHKVAVDRLNGITANGQTSIFTDFDELEKIDGKSR
jgi:DNA modification methylase